MAMINRFGIKQTDGTFQYHDIGAKGENVLLGEKTLTEVVGDITAEIVKKYDADGGEISGEVIPNGGLAHAGNSNYISFPEGGKLRTFSDTVGQLKIYLPSSWDNTLIKFKVSIANYQENSSVDYFISGYIDLNSRKWSSCSATSVGKYSGVLSNLKVSFGNDGTNCVIGIGDLDTLWQFATVSISDISINKIDGDNNYLKWAKDWSILINANTDVTFTKIIENPHVAQDVNVLVEDLTESTLEDAKGYTDQKIADLIGGAPETLDTLKEIAQEINENQGAIDTINIAINNKTDKTDFNNHAENAEIHVTLTDKNRWNAKQDVFTVDEYLSSVSVNPVQNKTIYSALADKVDKVSGKALSTNDFSNAYKTKIDGIEAGANAYVHPDSPVIPGTYTKVTVDQKGHVTEGSNPTLTIAEGGTGATTAAGALSNLGLTATAAEINKLDGVTATTAELNYVDGVTSNIQTQLNNKAGLSTATQSANGLFSATDKKKLDNITEGANLYVHPTYTAKTSGLYKITVDGLGHVSGATAVTKDDITALGVPSVNTTYGVATQSENGLMSSTDKTKLDGVETGANKYILPTASTSLGGVKTTSTVTNASGYTACPIINGVVYYKDSDTTYTLGSFGVTASSTELNYVDGVTSNIQTQLNGKLSTTGTAAAASKLANTAAIGSATQPVYFTANGVPSACTYNLKANILTSSISSGFNSAFRTQVTGSSSNSNFIGTVRSNSAISGYATAYSAGLVWGQADTQGYLMPNYSGTGQCFIGAGSADKLNWIKEIAFTDSNITGNAASATTLSSTLAVAKGGTGATDAATARSNLGVAYGTTAGTVCQGNDSRLSNSRPASDVYSWAKAASKPSYAWSEITSKPTSFTPASHDQAASTITTGTFPAAVYAYANTSYTTNMIRNGVFITTDPGAGASTSYANGSIIYVYE